MNPNSDENQKAPVGSEHEDDELETYGDDYITSKDARVPRWLIWSYILLPIWGIWSMYYYFNGSYGWLDRGYWNQLQRAALTTFPSGTIEGEGNTAPKMVEGVYYVPKVIQKLEL